MLRQPSVRKTDENVTQETLFKNRKITIHEVAKMSSISPGSVQSSQIAPKSCPAHACSALSLCEFQAESKITLIPHPSYSPDLA
jgi:hypothetical protein